MNLIRLPLLVICALLLPESSLRALTPGLQSTISLQGVVTFTNPQTPKTISDETNLVEYKATQSTVRFATTDLIGMVIGNDSAAEIKKWKLVGVRSLYTPGVDLNYNFYLVNVNKEISPILVSSSTLSASIYGTAESYTERWQGISPSATPVSGSGSFKFLAGLGLSLNDAVSGISLTTSLYGPATGSYKIASTAFGSEKYTVYVPGAIKFTSTGLVTISYNYGSDQLDAIGEFTLTAGASQPVDLDQFAGATLGVSIFPYDGDVSPQSPSS